MVLLALWGNQNSALWIFRGESGVLVQGSVGVITCTQIWSWRGATGVSPAAQEGGYETRLSKLDGHPILAFYFLRSFGLSGSSVLPTPIRTVICRPNTGEYHLDCSCPPPSVSCSSNETPARRRSFLAIHSKCIRRFRERIPKGCRTKAGYVRLVRDGFPQQTTD